MHVLLTGAQGYLGHAVNRELRRAGHRVTGLTRSTPANGGTLSVDLRDKEHTHRALAGEQYDVVCHLAALTRGRESHDHPLDYWESNASATVNLLRAVNPRTAVVLASTATIYGPDATGAISEDQPAQPGSPYAASKLAAEHIVTAWTEAFGSRSAVLRCFNVAGAVDNRSDPDQTRAVPAILRAAAGLRPTFTVNGDGSTLRDYTHVADVARAFRLAVEADHEGSHVYNVGTGTGLSLADLLAAASDVIGRAIPVEHQPAKREPARLIANPQRIRAQLGWRPADSDARTIMSDAWSALRVNLRPEHSITI